MNDEQAAQLKGFQVYDPVDPFENRAGPFFYRVDSTVSRCLPWPLSGAIATPTTLSTAD